MAERTTIARLTPEDSPLAAPEEILLGRYRVLARRGTGGFGVVCTCWDTRLQRRVAIKRLPVMAETGTATVDEALAEARTACMLAHPNIVAVHDFETDGAYAYLVMEFVDGLNLAELMARVEGGVLTPDECAHVLASVGKALKFAHENRVLHLDIKPANIMVDRTGTVKLTDFGMATLASAAGYGDARGGTVGYMPPEQIRGELVDERADVFSLAVVAWQALSGQNPFAAPTADASLKLIKSGPARSLAKTNPDIDTLVEQGLLDALVADGAYRTTSVDELVDAVVDPLGDTHEGTKSLRHLMGQSEPDETGEDVPWEDRYLPMSFNAPWLEPAAERVSSAVIAALAAHSVIHAAPQALPANLAGLAPWVLALATLAWPPLASLLAGFLSLIAVGSVAVDPSSFPLALAMGVALLLWWSSVGRREFLASAAVLLPCLSPVPMVGAPVAGFALNPRGAVITGVLGHLVGSVWRALAESGFSATGALAQIFSAWTIPGFWFMALGCAACAFVTSLVAMRGSVGSGIAAQGLGLLIAIVFRVVAARMENAGTWSTEDGVAMAVALLLFVILCIATVLRGPLYEDQEGED